MLALAGVLIGSTSALFAMSIGRELLADRDELIQKVRQQSGPSPSPSPSPSPTPGVPTPEEAAGAMWDARGVVLPLGAIWLILSLLLFSGCLRALRGSAWGASAWKTACAAWLGFQVIVFALVVIRLHEVPPPVLLVLGAIYPVGCLAYLRRPPIAGLFR
jgi:hypothetical protein